MNRKSHPLYLPKMRSLSQRRTSIVSVLDIGSTKLCCLIARLTPNDHAGLLAGRSHSVELLGYGYQGARGIKSGVVVDLDAAEQAISLCVDKAERMAGVTVGSLIINLSCGRLQSQIHNASIELERRSVTAGDIDRVLSASSAHDADKLRAIAHVLPISYSLDGNDGIHDPLDMMGNILGVDVQIVTADVPPIRNLELCVNRCHLEVEAMVATPYASGLSTVVDDEAELGVTCIDMGGGTTTLSVFQERQMIYLGVVPIGGRHVTMDIARALSTGLQDAERIKTLHGSALPTVADEREFISIPSVDRDGNPATQIPRAVLTRIVRPRIEEIFELLRSQLERSCVGQRINRRIVLTGGASQLTGVTDLASRILGCKGRLGRPLGIRGLPEAAKGPAFSTAVGLLIYPQFAGMEQFRPYQSRFGWRQGQECISRIGRWFKESF